MSDFDPQDFDISDFECGSVGEPCVQWGPMESSRLEGTLTVGDSS